MKSKIVFSERIECKRTDDRGAYPLDKKKAGKGPRLAPARRGL